MVTVNIEADKLFKAKGVDQKNTMIHDKIMEAIPTKENNYNINNLYCFNPDLILKNEFDWEINISIEATRSFDQIAVIFNPMYYGQSEPSIIYINGPKFLPNEKLTAPYYVKQPPDIKI